MKASPLPPAPFPSACLPACWIAGLLAGCWLAGCLAGWLLAGWLLELREYGQEVVKWNFPGVARVLVGPAWLPELREHGQERVEWSFPGGYNKRNQMATRHQTTRLQDYKLPNCRTTGLQATKMQECRTARTTWTANCKIHGLQGLPNANLINYPSQPGGPQGAGGYTSPK